MTFTHLKKSFPPLRFSSFLILGTATAAALLTFPVPGRPAAGAAPRAFLEPLSKVFLMENHHEAVAIWAREGLRGATVLHVDAHHDMLTGRGPEDLQKTAEKIRAGDISALEEAAREINLLSEYNLTNYIAAAYHTGIVKEIWWVYPFWKDFDTDFLQGLKTYLAEQQRGTFEKAEVDRFRIRGKHLTGTLNGIPVTVSRPEDLPSFREPVILDIDCDYFVGDLSPTGWHGMREHLLHFRDILKEKKIPLALATISYSTEGHYLPLHFRYVGSILRIWLEHPGEAGAFDGAAWDIYWEGEASYLDGDFAAARKRFESAAGRSRQVYPYASLALAFTDMAQGRFREAFQGMDLLAGEYPGLSLGFAIMGDYFYVAGRMGEAVSAYRALRRHNRGGRLDIKRNVGNVGVIYFNSGNYQEAVHYYAVMRSIFPEEAVFYGYLGDALFLTEDYEGALESYSVIWEKKNLSHQYENPNFLGFFLKSAEILDRPELAEEIRRAIAALPPSVRPPSGPFTHGGEEH